MPAGALGVRYLTHLVLLLHCITMTKRISKVLTVSLPPEAARDFELLAQAEGRNKSELFREMLRVYGAWKETQQFESLQRYGAAQSARLGIKDESDVEKLIDEFRRG